MANHLEFFRKHFLLGCIITTTLIWLAFRPIYFANVDEHNYLLSAARIANGSSLQLTEIWQQPAGFENQSAKYISKYNIGASLWYSLPMGIAGVEGVLIWAWLTFLALLVVADRIRKHYQLSVFWISIVALNPIIIYYARTAFSELPAALLLVTGFFAALKLINWDGLSQRWLWGLVLGSSLGAMVLVRYSLAIWALLLVSALALSAIQHYGIRRFWQAKLNFLPSFLAIIIGSLPALLVLLVVNSTLYGSVLSSGYKFSGEEIFNLGLLPQRLGSYLLHINVLPPFLLLFALFAKQKLSKLILIFTIILILFHSVAGGFLFQGELSDSIIGLRFLVPILPLLCLNYASSLQAVKFNSLLKSLILILLTGSFLLSSIFLSYQHQNFLAERVENAQIVRQLISKLDSNATLLIGDEEDMIYLNPGIDLAARNIGYLNINDYLNNKINTSNFEIILFMEVSYSNNLQRPSKLMLKSLEDLQDGARDKINLVASADKIKIYQLKTIAAD